MSVKLIFPSKEEEIMPFLDRLFTSKRLKSFSIPENALQCTSLFSDCLDYIAGAEKLEIKVVFVSRHVVKLLRNPNSLKCLDIRLTRLDDLTDSFKFLEIDTLKVTWEYTESQYSIYRCFGELPQSVMKLSLKGSVDKPLLTTELLGFISTRKQCFKLLHLSGILFSSFKQLAKYLSNSKIESLSITDSNLNYKFEEDFKPPKCLRFLEFKSPGFHCGLNFLDKFYKHPAIREIKLDSLWQNFAQVSLNGPQFDKLRTSFQSIPLLSNLELAKHPESGLKLRRYFHILNLAITLLSPLYNSRVRMCGTYFRDRYLVKLIFDLLYGS